MKAKRGYVPEDDRNFSEDQILKAVDKALWEKENVITSDSIILDHCKSWFNLMGNCIKNQGIRPLQVWE